MKNKSEEVYITSCTRTRICLSMFREDYPLRLTNREIVGNNLYRLTSAKIDIISKNNGLTWRLTHVRGGGKAIVHLAKWQDSSKGKRFELVQVPNCYAWVRGENKEHENKKLSLLHALVQDFNKGYIPFEPSKFFPNKATTNEQWEHFVFNLAEEFKRQDIKYGNTCLVLERIKRQYPKLINF